MGNDRTKVDALKDLGEKVTGATLVPSENETIVGMIDKIANKYSGGGSGGSGSSALVLSTIPPYDDDIPVDINDASDLEQLEALKNQYLTGGKNLPTQVIFDSLDKEGKRFLRYAKISNINTDSSTLQFNVVIETNTVVGDVSYEFIIFKDGREDIWRIGI